MRRREKRKREGEGYRKQREEEVNERQVKNCLREVAGCGSECKEQQEVSERRGGWVLEQKEEKKIVVSRTNSRED